MPPNIELTRDGPVSAPLNYTVPNAGELLPLAVEALVDGTSAAVPFYAVLQVLDPNGRSMGKYKSASIAAGGSADVSWFRGLGNGAGGGFGPEVIYSNTVVTPIDNFSTGGLSQSHTDLLIVSWLRTDEAGVVIREDTGIQISGDTDGSRYKTQRISLRDTTVASQQTTAAVGFNVLMSTGAAADSGAFAPSFFYIPNYTASIQHAGFGLEAGIGAFTGFPTNSWLYVTTARHNRAEAVSSLLITGGLGGPKFVAGSSITIYGLG